MDKIECPFCHNTLEVNRNHIHMNSVEQLEQVRQEAYEECAQIAYNFDCGHTECCRAGLKIEELIRAKARGV